MGMMWFIFSEVMFFAAFFGALLYARQFSVPWLGGEGVKIFTKFLLWHDYEAAWPTNGPGNVGGDFEVIPAFGLPAINTAILLPRASRSRSRITRSSRQSPPAENLPGR